MVRPLQLPGRMRLCCIVVILLGTVRLAGAEPDRYVVGAGVMGGEPGMALALEAGMRLGSTPLFAHALVAHGGSEARANYTLTYWDIDGSLLHARAGLEARGCRSSAFCGFVGIDGGYQSAVYFESDESMIVDQRDQGPIIHSRAGLDLGGEHLRFRVSLDFQERYGSASTYHQDQWDDVWLGSAMLAYRM
jgi:hypothetical protein